MDIRLSKLPPFRDLPTFTSGWWESKNTNAVKGDDMMALCRSLAFTYVGDELLIPDAATRIRCLKLHWLFLIISRELRTPQWYSLQDFENLQAKLNKFATECSWLMDTLGDANVGRGMNIIKMHDLLSAVQQIKLYGCMNHGDTGWAERFFVVFHIPHLASLMFVNYLFVLQQSE